MEEAKRGVQVMRAINRILRRNLHRFWRDRRGTIFVYTAIAAPLLLGFAGLSVDVGIWYSQARMAQSAADSAAISGALQILRSNSVESEVLASATADAGVNGFTAANGDTITIYYPPTSGPNKDSTDSVEVIVTRTSQSFLSQLVFSGTPTISARAVAMAALNDTCVWSLNSTDSGAIKVSGTSEVNLGCGVLSNSSNSSGVVENGSTSCLNATEVRVVGGASGDCFGSTPVTGVTPVSDPLGSLGPPSDYVPGGCTDNTNYSLGAGDTLTLTPGHYCGKITVNGGTLDFDPGLYILDGAGLSIGGSSTVTGTDVNFYLTENSGTADNINITGGTVTLTADGGNADMPGILFYHDRNTVGNITHTFSGGSTMNLEGILYFPNQDVRFSGGSELNTSTSLIIADTVTFVGNTNIGGFEDTPILQNPLLIEATLIE
jgi:Flp pilus assembly protein TadG